MPPNTHPVAIEHDQQQQEEEPADIDRTGEEAPPPPPTSENKRQISDRTNATVETTAVGDEPLPPLSQSLHQRNEQEDDGEEDDEEDTTGRPSSQQQLTSSQQIPAPSVLSRHVTVYDELQHFKSLSSSAARRGGDPDGDGDDANSSRTSFSRPGAHRVEGLNATSASSVGNANENRRPSGVADAGGGNDMTSGEHDRGQDQQRHGGTETDNDPTGGDGVASVDPFAEPYNVPSAYVVDEESQVHPEHQAADEEGSDVDATRRDSSQLMSPPMPAPPVVTVSGTLSNFATINTHDDMEEDDEKNGNKSKGGNGGGGCAVKFPCCEMRLSTPCLVAFAVVAVVVAVIVIVVVALLANRDVVGGGSTTSGTSVVDVKQDNELVDGTPIQPVVPPIETDDSDGTVVDVGDVVFPDLPPPDNHGDPEPVEPGHGAEDDPQESPIEPDPTKPMPIPEVLTDCGWQKLLAIDGAPDKRFGQHVAIEGDILAVSAPRDNENRGSIYVYERSNVSICCWSVWYEPAPETRWKFTKKLVADADNGQPGDELAFIDLSKTTIAAGAKKATVDGKNNVGAVYVWTRDDDGKWKHEDKLTPDDGQENDYFGNNLSIDKDVMIVTARLNDAVYEDSGAAYVYRRTKGRWRQEQKLIPDDAKAHDQFGSRVELQGDSAVISAYKSDDHGSDSGSAYVWKYNGKKFEQDAKLLPNDGAHYDGFGINVAIDTYGKNIVIGAYNDTEIGVTARAANKDGAGSGAAYVFSLTPSGEWAQSAKILAADGDKGHRFGRQVALNGNILVISSLSRYMVPDSGAIYVFRRTSDTTWEQQRKLITKYQVEDSFGSDLALDGLTILAGARYDTDNGYRSGSAHIIELC